MPIILAQDISKRFGSKTILHNISFHVNEGEIYYILGRSGAGKSVLMRILIGLIERDWGNLMIDGIDLPETPDQLSWQRLRSRIGVVFQHPALLDSLTVFENVGLSLLEHTRQPISEIRERVIQALKSVELSPDILTYYPSQLSGGMQKRVSIARAIIRHPRILFYDEPTSGLDPVTSQKIDELILHLNRKMQITSLIISHDPLSLFNIGDRCLYLERGEKVFEGTPQEMLSSEDVRAQEFFSRHKHLLFQKE
jgi:phospholipid/cholesterol/gamma-HCH transport system ATP-binding protein